MASALRFGKLWPILSGLRRWALALAPSPREGIPKPVSFSSSWSSSITSIGRFAVRTDQLELVLVTGAAGFIGSALCNRLADHGVPVRRATRRPGPQSDLAADLGPDTDWRPAVEGVTHVVHLAGRAHVLSEHSSDPLAEFRRVNTAGTLTLARAAAEAGARRFLFMSTAGVHGRVAGRILTEDDPFSPATPYAVSKAEAEQGLSDLGGPMEVVTLRPPLVYGPGAPGNFGRLVRLVGRGVPLPLGSATGRRSFVYVANLVDAIIAGLTGPGQGEALCVTDGTDLTSAELVERVAAALGRRSRLVPVPQVLVETAARLAGRSDDADRLFGAFQLDTSKIGHLLGWSPPFTLDEGITRTVQSST